MKCLRCGDLRTIIKNNEAYCPNCGNVWKLHDDRQDVLVGIYEELEILNQYLKVIVKEIQEMNQGIIITDDNSNP